MLGCTVKYNVTTKHTKVTNFSAVILRISYFVLLVTSFENSSRDKDAYSEIRHPRML